MKILQMSLHPYTSLNALASLLHKAILYSSFLHLLLYFDYIVLYIQLIHQIYQHFLKILYLLSLRILDISLIHYTILIFYLLLLLCFLINNMCLMELHFWLKDLMYCHSPTLVPYVIIHLLYTYMNFHTLHHN